MAGDHRVGLAVALAVGLYVMERDGKVAAVKQAADAEAERAAHSTVENSVNVKRANEFIRAQQQKKNAGR